MKNVLANVNIVKYWGRGGGLPYFAPLKNPLSFLEKKRGKGKEILMVGVAIFCPCRQSFG